LTCHQYDFAADAFMLLSDAHHSMLICLLNVLSLLANVFAVAVAVHMWLTYNAPHGNGASI